MRKAASTPEVAAKRKTSLRNYYRTSEGKKLAHERALANWKNPNYGLRKVAGKILKRNGLLHNSVLAQKVSQLVMNGATVVFTDPVGGKQKRPDIIYYKDNRVVGIDVKSDGTIETDFEFVVGTEVPKK